MALAAEKRFSFRAAAFHSRFLLVFIQSGGIGTLRPRRVVPSNRGFVKTCHKPSSTSNRPISKSLLFCLTGRNLYIASESSSLVASMITDSMLMNAGFLCGHNLQRIVLHDVHVTRN